MSASDPFRPLRKICGLTANEDALAAEALGADFLGVVLTPGFSRSVPVASAARVLAGTRAQRVAVIVDASVDEAVAAASALGASVIQLHGVEGAGLIRDLRARGEWRLWKAVRARTTDDVQRAVDDLGSVIDGILVEGWKEGVVGGGGARLELDAADVRATIPRDLDLILAGGLTPSTVASAVARFRPAVVDVSSGVEREPGRKDRELMKAFLEAAHRAPTT